MAAFILEHLHIFPTWLRSMLVLAWGLALLAIPIVIGVKVMQSPTMMTVFRAVPGLAKRIGAFLREQSEDPNRYPRIERVLQYGTIAQSYAFSVLLFAHFTVVVFLWGTTPKHLAAWEHIGVLGFSFLCAYAAAVFKAQGGKELIKVRRQRAARKRRER